MEIDTGIVQTGALYGVAPDRYCIKILGKNATVGIGEGVAADLQTRGRTAAVITG